ncbi:hypothetical protein GCM10027294_08330 [Marinactinospora endophytica]
MDGSPPARPAATVTPGSAGPGGPAPRRPARWRRHDVRPVAALLVLLPLAVGLPWWLERSELLAEGAMPPSAVPANGTGAGATAELAGTDWEFRGFVTGATDGSLTPLPAGTELVDAVVVATPRDARAGRLLQSSCEFRLVDDRGRSWAQTAAQTGRTLPEEVVETWPGCSGPDAEPVPPGTGQPMIATFLVPEDAVGSLRLQVRADTSEDPERPRPAAVEFRD